MFELVAVIVLAAIVPWALLFVMWRWLRTDAVARLRQARLFVIGFGVLAILFALLKHDTRDAIFSGLLTLFLVAALSGWLRRLMLWFGILFLVLAVCAGIFASGSIHGVMQPAGATVMGWVSVALTSLLTWVLLGAGVLCVWLSRRPVVPLRSGPATTPTVPPPVPPPGPPR